MRVKEKALIRCTKCGEEKPQSEFYASCSSHCKECRKARQRARYAPLKEQNRRRRQSVYKKGLKRCQSCNEYKTVKNYTTKTDNWDNLNHTCKDCVNRETRNKFNSLPAKEKDEYRKRRRQWYKDNRKKKLKQNAAWRRDNPDKSRAIWHRYKARKMNAEGNFTDEQWKMVKLYYAPNDRCPGCGKHRKITIDHVIPLAQKGPNYIANIQPLCKSCNSSKGDERYTDFRFDGGVFAELVQEAWG